MCYIPMWAEIYTAKLIETGTYWYWIKFNNWYQDPHSVKSMPKPPLRQVQVEQNVFLTHDPQQSPPSKLHSGIFVSSLQNPFETSDGFSQFPR